MKKDKQKKVIIAVLVVLTAITIVQALQINAHLTSMAGAAVKPAVTAAASMVGGC